MKKTLSVLLAVSLLLALTAGAAVPAAAADPESPAGIYKLTGVTCGSGSDLAIVSAIVDMGVKYYLILRGDGTGSMRFLEADISLEWDENSIFIPNKRPVGGPDHFSIPYTFADGVLKMSTKAYTLDFGALTAEEQAYYEANGSGSLSGLISKAVQSLTNLMDGDLTDALLSALGMGAGGSEEEPIPDGEPSEAPVTGVVEGIEFKILGAYSAEKDGKPYIILNFDATNVSDDIRTPGDANFGAAQDGAFLDIPFDVDIGFDQYNINYGIWPGLTIRCSYAFDYDPDGGTVGFRINSYHEENSVLFYADPKNLDDAPEKPFDFNTGVTIPEELRDVPEEAEHVSVEKVEFYTAEDGSDAVRFFFRYLNDASSDGKYHSCMALQDGIQLPVIYTELDFYADENAAADRLRTLPCRLRTDSPVVFLVLESTDDDTIVEAARILEVG